MATQCLPLLLGHTTVAVFPSQSDVQVYSRGCWLAERGTGDGSTLLSAVGDPPGTCMSQQRGFSLPEQDGMRSPGGDARR